LGWSGGPFNESLPFSANPLRAVVRHFAASIFASGVAILAQMKTKFSLLFGILLAAAAGPAQETNLTGVVTTRLVRPDGATISFLLVSPGAPNILVTASGADAAALVPRNAVSLIGSPADSPLGPLLKIKDGSVDVTQSNQPFKGAPITAAVFKDPSTNLGLYVQLPGVTFAEDKFDSSGRADVRTDDGSAVSILASRGAAGRTTPKGATDIFGVIVKCGDGYGLVAARFLPPNRNEMIQLATQRTCLSCHNPDLKVVGPAYRDVAAKYRNDPDAIAKIISQMENGGTGKWGTNVMPSLKAAVPADDMNNLANWIYGYRWDAILAE
jgi:cytochrome c551/c552